MTHHCNDPHCHDPLCSGHHAHSHTGAPEQASVFAVQRAFFPAAPVPRAALEEAALSAFRAIAESCCTDGILPGHAKGLIETGDAALALSVTSRDHIDTSPLGGWAELAAAESFRVTVNVHLVIPHALDEEALLAPFAVL